MGNDVASRSCHPVRCSGLSKTPGSFIPRKLTIWRQVQRRIRVGTLSLWERDDRGLGLDSGDVGVFRRGAQGGADEGMMKFYQSV